MKEKKQFKDTKVGKFLSTKLPVVLDIVGSVLPDKGVLAIVKNIISSDRSMSAKDKDEVNELILQQEIELEKIELEKLKSFHNLEATQLIQEDKFTKRARPFRQYFWLLLLTLCYPVSWFVSHEMITLPEIILIGIFSDFGLYTWKRTEEKNNISKLNQLL